MKKHIIAALLPFAFAALPAHATVSPSVVSSSFGGIHDLVESGTEILLAPSSFQGLFDFTLTGASVVSFTGFTTLPFLAFGLFDATDTIVGGSIFTPTTFDSSFTSINLDAGSYYYAAVVPTSGAMGSVYTFESRVTAVPEPQTYALFLAGLGMLGLAAHRRTRSDD